MTVRTPAISLWQPWASLIFVSDHGSRKLHETRSYPLPPRYLGERIAIHAAKRPVPKAIDADLELLCIDLFGVDFRSSLPRGAVVGTVMIDQWTATEFCGPETDADSIAGDWTNGRFAWRLRNPQQLETPLPQLGQQGWFRVEIPETAVHSRSDWETGNAR